MLPLPNDIITKLIIKLETHEVSKLRQTHKAWYQNEIMSERCYSDSNEMELAKTSGLALYQDGYLNCAQYIATFKGKIQKEFNASTDIWLKKEELQGRVLNAVSNFERSKIIAWNDPFRAPEVMSFYHQYRGALLLIEFEYLFEAQKGNAYHSDFPGSALDNSYKENRFPFFNRESLHQALQDDNDSLFNQAHDSLQCLQHLEIFVAYHSGRKWQITPYLTLLHAKDNKIMAKNDVQETNDPSAPLINQPKSECILL